MKLPNYIWIIIAAIFILLIGRITYSIATRNRGSFADTPEWSKVIRRIIEVICVFVFLLFTIYLAWDNILIVKILLIVFPISGVILGFFMPKIFKWIENIKKDSSEHFKNTLAEHLINTIILVIFQLSGLLVVFAVSAYFLSYNSTVIYFLMLLVFLLSIELPFLLYQIYHLIFVDSVPNDETVHIVRICKELND